MKKRKSKISILTTMILVAAGCATLPPREAEEPLKTATMARIKNTTIDTFQLPAPEENLADYLGIPAGQEFRLPQVKADVLLIEAYSLYCPHCQKEAPQVNELYRAIEENPDLKGRIKIVGLAVGNSDYEVNLFREKFSVPFPLFSDKELTVNNALGIELTPTFLGIRFLENGTHVIFLWETGAFGDVSEFLKTIVRTSRM